ncbi:MAG: hypothetical protein JWM99_4819 [Verrucomicrobiales bacterium]|nr:hypothetical protein [Verrucomicrobiales bacterium]
MRFVFKIILLGLLQGSYPAGQGKLVGGGVFLNPERGFYFSPFNLTISTDITGASLVYTTDGSQPSRTNGTAVRATKIVLPVTNTTLIRAVALKEGREENGVATHSFIFPSEVANQTRPAAVPAKWPENFPASFEMNGLALKNPLPGFNLTNALLSIPSISLVMRSTDLWGITQGLYANPSVEQERAASFEILFPGRKAFQADAGVSLRGFASRVKSLTPKHSFTIVFRSKYGPSKFSGALFPDSAVTNFNALVLRANAVDSWANSELTWNHSIDGEMRWYRDRATYVRDQWMRDSQQALGQPSSHGRFVHVYLNGFYWGLYNLDERLDKHWAAAHLGGKALDYDVLASGKLKAGTLEAWNQLMAAAGADLSNRTNYQRLMGNDANGARNPSYPVLLNLDSLVDYMILHIYAGADDWPWHNWVVVRSRMPGNMGFKFLAWDQELSINSLVKEHTDIGQVYADVDAGSTPAYLYARCRANADFRQLFADRVQRHLFGTGALSVASNLERYKARVNEIDHAIVAESSRWGGFYRPENPYLRREDWIRANEWMCGTFFPANQAVALKRFRKAALFPEIEAPRFRKLGTNDSGSSSLNLENPNASGDLYFTEDGPDPRNAGGSVASNAKIYSESVQLKSQSVIRARVRKGTEWSPLTETGTSR